MAAAVPAIDSDTVNGRDRLNTVLERLADQQDRRDEEER